MADYTISKDLSGTKLTVSKNSGNKVTITKNPGLTDAWFAKSEGTEVALTKGAIAGGIDANLLEGSEPWQRQEDSWDLSADPVFSNDGTNATSKDVYKEINANLISGATYTFSYTIDSISVAGVRPVVGGAVGDAETTPGSYSEDIVTIFTNSRSGMRALAGTVCQVSNLSIVYKSGP